MKMKIVVASLCLLSVFASELNATNVIADETPNGRNPYDVIFNVRAVDDPKGEVDAKIFETGGGDPAMNGNILILNLATSDPAGNSHTWQTGLNINEIKSASIKDHKLTIKGTEHRQDENGGIKTFPITIEIKYALKDGLLDKSIDVTKK